MMVAAIRSTASRRFLSLPVAARRPGARSRPPLSLFQDLNRPGSGKAFVERHDRQAGYLLQLPSETPHLLGPPARLAGLSDRQADNDLLYLLINDEALQRFEQLAFRGVVDGRTSLGNGSSRVRDRNAGMPLAIVDAEDSAHGLKCRRWLAPCPAHRFGGDQPQLTQMPQTTRSVTLLVPTVAKPHESDESKGLRNNH